MFQMERADIAPVPDGYLGRVSHSVQQSMSRLPRMLLLNTLVQSRGSRHEKRQRTLTTLSADREATKPQSLI